MKTLKQQLQEKLGYFKIIGNPHETIDSQQFRNFYDNYLIWLDHLDENIIKIVREWLEQKRQIWEPTTTKQKERYRIIDELLGELKE